MVLGGVLEGGLCPGGGHVAVVEVAGGCFSVGAGVFADEV